MKINVKPIHDYSPSIPNGFSITVSDGTGRQCVFGIGGDQIHPPQPRYRAEAKWQSTFHNKPVGMFWCGEHVPPVRPPHGVIKLATNRASGDGDGPPNEGAEYPPRTPEGPIEDEPPTF